MFAAVRISTLVKFFLKTEWMRIFHSLWGCFTYFILPAHLADNKTKEILLVKRNTTWSPKKRFYLKKSKLLFFVFFQHRKNQQKIKVALKKSMMFLVFFEKIKKIKSFSTKNQNFPGVKKTSKKSDFLCLIENRKFTSLRRKHLT